MTLSLIFVPYCTWFKGNLHLHQVNLLSALMVDFLKLSLIVCECIDYYPISFIITHVIYVFISFLKFLQQFNKVYFKVTDRTWSFNCPGKLINDFYRNKNETVKQLKWTPRKKEYLSSLKSNTLWNISLYILQKSFQSWFCKSFISHVTKICPNFILHSVFFVNMNWL